MGENAMKSAKSLFGICLPLVGFLVGFSASEVRAAFQARAVPDVLVAAPDEYKLEFENEFVRVSRIKSPAHGKAPMHAHPSSTQRDTSMEIWNLRRERMEFATKKDIAKWSALTAYDWDGTVVNKSLRITEIQNGRFMGQIPSSEPTGDWAVRQYGDMAIATWTSASGRNALLVAVRQSGQWIAVHEQQTPKGTPTR
jgi:hypothetical protein